MRKLIQFLKEVRLELKKVSWPSRKELVGSTTLVIVASIISGLCLGVFDILFSQVILRLIKFFGS